MPSAREPSDRQASRAGRPSSGPRGPVRCLLWLIILVTAGSNAWIAASIRRSRVEGAFGMLKSSKTENVRRGWTHVVGLVTGLMAVIAQAAANLRCLRAWAARTGDRTDPLTHLDPEDDGLEEIDPAAAPPASTGPPAAA